MTRQNSSWTEDELARLRRIIQLYGRRRVRWELYVDQFDHPPDSTKTMASRIRQKMRSTRERHANQSIRNAIRAIINSQEAEPSIFKKAETAKPALPAMASAKVFEEHRITSSTQALQFAAEMMNRIGTRGITAGLLGDPLPGRSVLDKRRAGIVDPAPRRLGNPSIPKPVTLPTRPWKDAAGRP